MTLIDKMADYGIEPPANIIADSEIHYFKSGDDDKNKTNGWYILSDNSDFFDNSDFQVGAFGCLKRGIKEGFCSVDESTFTPEQKQQYDKQMNEVREKYKQERTAKEAKAKEAKAKELAQKRFNEANADNVDENAYLVEKRVNGYNLRQEGYALLVPMFYNKEIVNIQTINNNGKINFSDDGRVNGSYHLIGEPKNKIIVCEGYSTGASIHQAVNECVAVCFNAANLERAAKHLKDLYPSCNFLIAGDDDRHNPKNTGKDNAIKTACALNCDYILPKFKYDDLANNPTDFNDIHCLYGLDKVKEQIASIKQEITPTQTIISNKQEITPTQEIKQYDSEGRPKKQADVLIGIAEQNYLFHNEENETFAKISVDKHHQIWATNSQGFKDWLNSEYYNLTQRGANSNAIKDCLNTITGNAIKAVQQEVYLRVAQIKDKIYIDTCNDKWQVIEVSNTGFRVLDNSPIAFIRKNGMLPLPEPQKNADIDLLRKYLNIKDDDFYLVVGWVLMTLQANKYSGYPILILQGEQGTAKSTTTKMLRMLTDPHKVNIRMNPKLDDLINMACNNRLIALDNLSGMQKLMSDTLCGFSTVTGHSKRALYTNREDDTIELHRPMLLNGIDDLTIRGDFTSRSIVIDLPTITDRKSEKTLWQDFNNDLPNIFGALLTGLSKGLANIKTTKIDRLPRMADFAKWATACGNAYNWGDKFMVAYQHNIDTASHNTVENSPFASAIVKLVKAREFSGTATELLDQVEDYVRDRVKSSNTWLRTPRAVSNQLKRFTPALKTLGVEVSYRKSNGKHLITLTKTNNTDQDPR